MPKVIIYTDGACSGNPGPGGWAAILIYKERKKELSGGKQNTTNNIMEMTAILEGLKALKVECDVELYSDSAYCVNAFNKKWIFKWAENGWQTADKKEVKNKEIWQEIFDLTKKHNVKFIKVKGHSDNELNNRCDELAKKAIENLERKGF